MSLIRHLIVQFEFMVDKVVNNGGRKQYQTLLLVEFIEDCTSAAVYYKWVDEENYCRWPPNKWSHYKIEKAAANRVMPAKDWTFHQCNILQKFSK